MPNIPDVTRTKVDVRHPNFWSATLNSAAAQTGTELVAAPGASLRLVVTDIVVSSAGAQITKLLGAAVDIYENVYTGNGNGDHVNNLITPLALLENVALNVTSANATAHSITVSGFTEPM